MKRIRPFWTLVETWILYASEWPELVGGVYKRLQSWGSPEPTKVSIFMKRIRLLRKPGFFGRLEVVWQAFEIV